MKKSNKNTLLKAIIGLIIVAVLLTWITPSATFTEGQYSAGDFERVGIFDLSTYSLMSFNYFSNVFAFLFILAGFSMFLGRLDAFKKLVKGIASKLKGKELDQLKKGDILVFKYDNKIISHRIYKIVERDNAKYYITKGDNNDQADAGARDEASIIGIVRMRFEKIGLPSIWINELFD